MIAGPRDNTADSGSLIISCGNCRVKNRVLKTRMTETPKCGKCGSSLIGSISGPGKPAMEGLRYSRSEAVQTSSSAPSLPLKSYSTGDLIGGRYRIQDICGGEGKSAMGIVYICYDLEYNRVLALKTLQDRYLGLKKTRDSFKKEALAWIHLGNHPYIVRAYWVREIENRMFIACEYIEPDAERRNSLTPFLKSGLELGQILRWSIEFCHGMEYACSKGVTPHRDIKPDNIMITDEGNVKIADFGLVGLWSKTGQTEEIMKLSQKDREGSTFLSTYNNRIVAGSPPWMAPEQFYGVAEARSDIYSFGIILFQMVSRGVLPFELRRGDTWRIAHKEYPVPSIPTRGAALAEVIATCLQKRRDKRYENFGALRIDIEKIFKREISKKTGEQPPPPPKETEIRESGLINKGMSLTNLGLIEEGIRNYQESIRINPHNAEAHYNLGNALSKKGHYREAIRAYREALRIEPDLIAAHFNLGIAFFQNGQVDDAILEYKEVLRIKPDFAAAYMNLGAAYHKTGLIDQALGAYGKAVKVDPQSADAYARLGNLHLSRNVTDKAIDAYTEALRINPHNAEVCNNLGTAYLKKEMADESVHAYGKALQLKPDYADAHYNLGCAFVRKDMRREALYAFEEFMKYSGQGDGRREKAKEFIGKLQKYR